MVLHGLKLKAIHVSHLKVLVNELTSKDVQVFATKKLEKVLRKISQEPLKVESLSLENPLESMDFLISVGGDGTMLDALCEIGAREIPILGLNTGRLGFLATVATKDIALAVQKLTSGDYQIENRSLISVDSDQNDPFDGLNFGLNEFTIHKRDTSSMITVHTYIDGQYLNSYWADGLIVSTPTGSTGYSLSCGGPLISPAAKNFVITPVSPHNLNVRPIIVSDQSEISFEIEGRSKKYLISLDSRSTSVSSKVKLKVRKEKFEAQLVKLPDYHFFDTLRHKLNWGFDMRN